MLRSILTVLLSLIAFISFNLGMDWVNLGHGLHPAIAFPIATVTFIIACFTGQFMDRVNR